MNAESAQISAWTRPRNDGITTAYDASRNDALLRHVTYSPEYLAEGSCVPGNTSNCHVFQTPDLHNEPRIGALTNLRTNQRATTHAPALGIATTPDMTSGPRLNDRLLNDMSTLEPRWGACTRDKAQYAMASRTNDIDTPDARCTYAYECDALIIQRDEIPVSTRVERRNAHAAQSRA